MSYIFNEDKAQRFSLELYVTSELCKIVDSPRSLAVHMLIKHEQWDQLVGLDINPSDYDSSEAFADDYLVTKVISKSVNIPLSVDRKAEALSSFCDGELRCLYTNERSNLGHLKGLRIDQVRQEIARILGPLTRADLDRIEDGFRFGPGATTGVRGVGSVKSDKYDSDLHLTEELIPYYRKILGNTWWEIASSPCVVSGNKFTNVPKSAKTDRGICIEPTLNIYTQLGVGTLLKDKLLRSGIDLYTQSRNQELASLAMERKLATIDLSMASDTLASCVVYNLLPPRWFELLDLMRSKVTTIGDTAHPLEKFSSMGNGFTFELESLIFWAVVSVCVPKREHQDCSVFGDDIICPQRYAQDVIDNLELLGFKVNTKKSFLAGRFFESCGFDFFDGRNVRPFYLKASEHSVLPYVLQIANKIRLYALQRGAELYCDGRFEQLWKTLILRVPPPFKHARVPLSFGDTGIISDVSEVPFVKPRDEIEGQVVKHVHLKPVKRQKRTIGRLLTALSQLAYVPGYHSPMDMGPSLFTYGREPVRGYLRKPVLKATVFSGEWPSLVWISK